MCVRERTRAYVGTHAFDGRARVHAGGRACVRSRIMHA